MTDTRLLQRLRTLIGRQVEYGGHPCRVIEILDTEQLLVLRREDGQTVIQGNQFGEAARRVQACHSLPLFDDQGELDPLIRRWLGED